MEAVVLLGAPGAGKGTVAEAIRARTGYLHMSTGDMLREAVEAGTALGRQARAYMDKGELVPDSVIVNLVTERLKQGAPDGRYLFDGFPRTDGQARLLDRVFADLGGRIRHVFLLEAPRDVLVERIAGRRICRNCGAVYHVRNIPSRRPGVCDRCGGELYQRADDTEATVVNRLEVFKKQTESLIDYYEDKQLLIRVDAGAAKEQTEEAILAILAQP
jgi:adenylate kinase